MVRASLEEVHSPRPRLPPNQHLRNGGSQAATTSPSGTRGTPSNTQRAWNCGDEIYPGQLEGSLGTRG